MYTHTLLITKCSLIRADCLAGNISRTDIWKYPEVVDRAYSWNMLPSTLIMCIVYAKTRLRHYHYLLLLTSHAILLKGEVKSKTDLHKAEL